MKGAVKNRRMGRRRLCYVLGSWRGLFQVGSWMQVSSLGYRGVQAKDQIAWKEESAMNMNPARTLRILYRRLPRILQFIIHWGVLIVLATIGDYTLLYILSILTSLKLIEWSTVISFLAVEVLAVVIARLLGIGQESEEEKKYRRLRLAALMGGLVPRYEHLLVLCLKGEEKEYPEYPKSQYYVLNTRTKIAYWADLFLCDLMQETAMKRQVFSCASQLAEYLERSEVKLEKRYPEGDELQIQTRHGRTDNPTNPV
jgi:hypothetical protein